MQPRLLMLLLLFGADVARCPPEVRKDARRALVELSPEGEKRRPEDVFFFLFCTCEPKVAQFDGVKAGCPEADLRTQ